MLFLSRGTTVSIFSIGTTFFSIRLWILREQMPCILFIPLPTARRPYWRQGGWTVDICERNKGEMSPPRPVPWPSISAQAEQGGQASPPRPGAASITGTLLLKGEPTLRRCLLTFPKSHSEVGWLCSRNTRGRNVKQVVEAMAVTKAVWATDLTEEVTQQRMQACRHVKQEGRAPRLEPMPRQLWKLGFHQEDVLDEGFLPAPQGPFQGRSTGKWVLLLTWVWQAAPQVPVPGSPHSTKIFHTLPFPFLQPATCFCLPVYSEASCISIRQNRSVAFSTTKSKIFLLFHLQR